jgi:hypothetical protein
MAAKHKVCKPTVTKKAEAKTVTEAEQIKAEQEHGFFSDVPVVVDNARVIATKAWRRFYQDLKTEEYILSDDEYRFAYRFARNVEETNPEQVTLTLTIKKWNKEDLYEVISNGFLNEFSADECICSFRAIPVFFRIAHLLPADYNSAMGVFESNAVDKVVLKVRR